MDSRKRLPACNEHDHVQETSTTDPMKAQVSDGMNLNFQSYTLPSKGKQSFRSQRFLCQPSNRLDNHSPLPPPPPPPNFAALAEQLGKEYFLYSSNNLATHSIDQPNTLSTRASCEDCLDHCPLPAPGITGCEFDPYAYLHGATLRCVYDSSYSMHDCHFDRFATSTMRNSCARLQEEYLNISSLYDPLLSRSDPFNNCVCAAPVDNINLMDSSFSNCNQADNPMSSTKEFNQFTSAMPTNPSLSHIEENCTAIDSTIKEKQSDLLESNEDKPALFTPETQPIFSQLISIEQESNPIELQLSPPIAEKSFDSINASIFAIQAKQLSPSQQLNKTSPSS